MPNETVERLPDPKTFNPKSQPLPERPPVGEGIPEILEFKLDVIMVKLQDLVDCLGIIKVILANIFVVILAGLLLILVGLAIIIAQLNAIIAQLNAVNAALGVIIGLLALILFFILFIVIRVVVPFIRDNLRP